MWLRFQTSTACSSNVFLSDHTHPPSSHSHVFSFPVLSSVCRQRRWQKARDVSMSRAGAPGSSGLRPLLSPECALSTSLGYFWLPPPQAISGSPPPHTPSQPRASMTGGGVGAVLSEAPSPQRRWVVGKVLREALGCSHAAPRAHSPGPVSMSGVAMSSREGAPAFTSPEPLPLAIPVPWCLS